MIWYWKNTNVLQKVLTKQNLPGAVRSWVVRDMLSQQVSEPITVRTREIALLFSPRKYGSNCIFKFIHQTHFANWQLGQFQWNLCKMHTAEPINDKPTLVQTMPCCRQATSHYLSQCPPIFIAPYGVIKTRWVKERRSVNPLRCGIQTQSKQKNSSGSKITIFYGI